MVKIIYSLPGCKNYETHLTEILKKSRKGAFPDYSGVLYLSPTQLTVRDAQRRFYKISGSKCYIPPETATIGQLSKRIYSPHGNKRILPDPLIPAILSRLSGKSIGFSVMTADFIKELKGLYPSENIEEIRGIFAELFDKFNMPESAAKPAIEALETFKKYQIFLEENSLTDENDIINSCAGLVELMPWTALIIDGFYDLANNEKNLIKGLIHHAVLTLINVPFEQRFSELSASYINFLKQEFDTEVIYPAKEEKAMRLDHYSFSDAEAEIKGIARSVKALYTSGKFTELGEIVVAFPDLKKCSLTVERVFRRYGIPFEISRGKPVAKSRPFLDLICLLSSVAEDYPRLKFSQFLSSGYFRKLPVFLKKYIPISSLQSGIISGKASWLNFTAEGSETVDLKGSGTDLLNAIQWVFKQLKPIEDIRRGAAIRTHTDTLKKVIARLGFLETSVPAGYSAGLKSRGKEDPELHEISADEKKLFNAVLEQVTFIGSLFTDKINLNEFIEIFSQLLDAGYVDKEGQGVKVMDLSEVMGLTPEYLYLGRLTDEAMPGKQPTDYILPDNVKRSVGFMYLNKFIDNQRFIFNFITKNCRHLHLSYYSMDGENMFLPSSCLYPGEELKERITGIFSGEEYQILKGDMPFSRRLSEIGIQISIPEFSQSLKVTDIDAYRACARKFFIEKLMRLHPAEIKEYEVEAVTVGNLLHKIMEKLIPEPLGALSSFEKRAIEIINVVIKDKKIDAYWKRLIAETFIELLPDIYEKEQELRKNGYSETEVEKDISGEPVAGIKLKGKTDRIDKTGDAVHIIDYKTGSAKMTCTQALKGNENLQLFLYAAILKNQGHKVDRVGIYSLKDIALKWCPPKKNRGKVNEGNSIEDYISHSLEFLGEAVKKMRNGDFRAQPLNEYNCTNCHEYALCPYIHNGS